MKSRHGTEKIRKHAPAVFPQRGFQAPFSVLRADHPAGLRGFYRMVGRLQPAGILAAGGAGMAAEGGFLRNLDGSAADAGPDALRRRQLLGKRPVFPADRICGKGNHELPAAVQPAGGSDKDHGFRPQQEPVQPDPGLSGGKQGLPAGIRVFGFRNLQHPADFALSGGGFGGQADGGQRNPDDAQQGVSDLRRSLYGFRQPELHQGRSADPDGTGSDPVGPAGAHRRQDFGPDPAPGAARL